MSSSITQKRRWLQLRSERKKNTSALTMKLSAVGISFELLNDDERYSLIERVREKAKELEKHGEYRIDDIKSVSREISDRVDKAALDRDFVFSSTDYTRSPFVRIFVHNWADTLEKIMAVLEAVRIYYTPDATTISIEYDKFEKQYVVEYELWERSYSLEDLELEAAFMDSKNMET